MQRSRQAEGLNGLSSLFFRTSTARSVKPHFSTAWGANKQRLIAGRRTLTQASQLATDALAYGKGALNMGQSQSVSLHAVVQRSNPLRLSSHRQPSRPSPQPEKGLPKLRSLWVILPTTRAIWLPTLLEALSTVGSHRSQCYWRPCPLC